MVELLEGAQPRHEAVLQRDPWCLTGFELEPPCHDEHLARERPGGFQHLGSFLRVFYDIDYVPEIDDLRRRTRAFGTMNRIPAITRDALLTEALNIPPAPAAVIENRSAR